MPCSSLFLFTSASPSWGWLGELGYMGHALGNTVREPMPLTTLFSAFLGNDPFPPPCWIPEHLCQHHLQGIKGLSLPKALGALFLSPPPQRTVVTSVCKGWRMRPSVLNAWIGAGVGRFPHQLYWCYFFRPPWTHMPQGVPYCHLLGFVFSHVSLSPQNQWQLQSRDQVSHLCYCIRYYIHLKKVTILFSKVYMSRGHVGHHRLSQNCGWGPEWWMRAPHILNTEATISPHHLLQVTRTSSAITNHQPQSTQKRTGEIDGVACIIKIQDSGGNATPSCQS